MNACGDAGFLTTDDADIANKVRLLRNHGLADRNTVGKFGAVSRMDTLQAAILTYRLSRLAQMIERRRNNVDQYKSLLNLDQVFIPEEHEEEFNTYHTFVIQCEKRDALQRYLMVHGIETAIHYPIPIHLQPAASNFGYSIGNFPVTEKQSERILTLPIHQYLKKNDIKYVCEFINKFFKK